MDRNTDVSYNTLVVTFAMLRQLINCHIIIIYYCNTDIPGQRLSTSCTPSDMPMFIVKDCVVQQSSFGLMPYLVPLVTGMDDRVVSLGLLGTRPLS